MVPDKVEKEMMIDAPAKYVWQALTDADQLMEWFPNEATLDLRPGGVGKFVWHDRAANQDKSGTAAWLQVVDVNEPSLFSFRWGHPQGVTPTPQNSVLVEFTLTEEGFDKTRLRVVESGLREIVWPDDTKLEYIEDHKLGWDKHLADLQTYVSKHDHGA